jgi:hypothetical protein
MTQRLERREYDSITNDLMIYFRKVLDGSSVTIREPVHDSKVMPEIKKMCVVRTR